MSAPTRPRERELEAAWRRHEPRRAKVPYPARRAAEAFRESIIGDAEKVRLTYQSKPFRRILADWAKAASLGRSHTTQRLAAAIAPAHVDVISGALRLMWLESHAERLTLIDDPRYDQPAVLIVGALVRRTGRSLSAANGFPVVEVSEHALRRIFERAPNIDVKAALLGAAHAFLAADFKTVEERRLAGGTLCLRCGPGLLLSEILYCADRQDKPRLFARANTWISWAAAEPGQRPIARATDPAATVLAAVSGT
jgi:hypothetical protein